MESDISCVVCGAKAHGSHFQALTCRACAAFFRRAVGAPVDVYRCRRATNDCEIVEKSNFNCKSCRLRRCLNAGMIYKTSENKASFSQSGAEDRRLSGSIAVLELHSSMSYGHNCVNYDSNPLMERIRETLTQKPQQRRNDEILAPLVARYRSFNYCRGVDQQEVSRVVDLCEWMRSFECGIAKAAEWAMSNAEFADLGIEDKWHLFKYFLTDFSTIEMVARSVDVFGDEEDTRFLYAENMLCELYDFKFSVPFEPQAQKDFEGWFDPHREMFDKLLVKPMKAIRMTAFEVNYLLLQLLWSTERADDLSDDARLIGTTVLERASNEMHRHYVRDVRMENYAARLAKILKLQSCMNEMVHYEKNLVKVAEVFGIFKHGFMDSPLAESYRT